MPTLMKDLERPGPHRHDRTSATGNGGEGLRQPPRQHLSLKRSGACFVGQQSRSQLARASGRLRGGCRQHPTTTAAGPVPYGLRFELEGRSPRRQIKAKGVQAGSSA